MIKTILALITSFTCYAAQSSEFDGFNPKYAAHLSKLRNFMSRNDKCYLSYVSYVDGTKLQEMDLYGGLNYKVNCIADIVYKQGTIDEKSGCTLNKYDTKSDRYINFSTNTEMPMASKLCRQGGFEELVEKMGYWGIISYEQEPYRGGFSGSYSPKKTAVTEAMFYRIHTAYVEKLLLLNASSTAAKKWFDEKNGAFLKTHIAEVNAAKVKQRKKAERGLAEAKEAETKEKERQKKKAEEKRKLEELYE